MRIVWLSKTKTQKAITNFIKIFSLKMLFMVKIISRYWTLFAGKDSYCDGRTVSNNFVFDASTTVYRSQYALGYEIDDAPQLCL